MRSLLILVILFMSIMLSGCGQYEDTYTSYESSITFKVNSYYDLDYKFIDSSYINVSTYTSSIIDHTTNFSYSLDIYDKGIITKIMNSIEYLSINELVNTYNNNLIYTWSNIYQYEINIKYIGYSGSNRLYNLVLFINNTYVDSFIVNIDYRNNWHIE